MRSSVVLLLLFVASLLLVGCGGAGSPEAAEPTPAASLSGDLVIFAAASLTEAFTEIGEQFQADNPDATVTFNFAGSQDLAAQLGEGAPADLFASANTAQMNAAVEAGRVVTGTQQIFVRNRLVVVFPSDNPRGVDALEDLAEPGLLLVFAAEETPIGRYSLEFLDKASADPAFGAGFRDAVLANVQSYEQTVRAVLSKVELGEADAGIVYTSDVSPTGGAAVGQLEIPDELNVVASYPIAPISDSENAELAQAFIELVLSPAGREVLARYGFIAVSE